jgi:hypothetical protein
MPGNFSSFDFLTPFRSAARKKEQFPNPFLQAVIDFNLFRMKLPDGLFVALADCLECSSTDRQTSTQGGDAAPVPKLASPFLRGIASIS